MSGQQTADAGASFNDLVLPEQSANQIEQGAPEAAEPKGEQPVPAEGQEPAKAEGNEPTDGQKPEGGKEPEDKDLFWGKFKTSDDAKSSYDQAQTKIIEQGTKINELAKQVEENAGLLTALDAALAKNPELANQIKQALADSGENQEEKTDDIDSLLDKKLAERERKAQIKTERDDWMKNHPDVSENDGELGHKILDLLEKDGLPVTAKTMQMAYDHLTKDAKIAEASKKAADEALKKEEIAELDRQNGAGVGGGNIEAKTEPSKASAFDELVGHKINSNRLY